jgi:hypothetical protein
MATPTSLPASFTTGQVLTAAQMNNIRGAFRILQVVSGSASTQVSSTTTTWADTTLSATITPQSSSSLVLVMYSQNCYSQGSATGMGLRLVRDLPSANTVLRTDADLIFGTNSGVLAQQTFFHLDNPATTSALTYKTQFNRSVGSATVFVQTNGANQQGTMLLFEVSA